MFAPWRFLLRRIHEIRLAVNGSFVQGTRTVGSRRQTIQQLKLERFLDSERTVAIIRIYCTNRFLEYIPKNKAA